ncbi:MAG: hypothetical protein AAF570_04655 [Bacteroidota bacterium]
MGSYTFNKPVTALFVLPLIALMALLIYGISREFNVVVLLLFMFTLLLLLPILYLSFLRRLRFSEASAHWKTPSVAWDMDLGDVQHYGIIKYRMFRFIFMSKVADIPFEDPSKPVVSTEDTFLVQYRKSAWNEFYGKMQKLKPDLKPLELIRR